MRDGRELKQRFAVVLLLKISTFIVVNKINLLFSEGSEDYQGNSCNKSDAGDDDDSQEVIFDSLRNHLVILLLVISC